MLPPVFFWPNGMSRKYFFLVKPVDERIAQLNLKSIVVLQKGSQ